MKGKLGKGNGFRGVLNYVMGKGENATLVGGNMAGSNPRELAAEFAIPRSIAPETKNPVIHMSLGVPPGDTLTDEQWDQAARIVMREMELDPDARRWVMVKHTDRDHEHVHIIASKIADDGKKWNASFEVKKMIAGTQRAERELGLTQTKGLGSKPAKRVDASVPSLDRIQAAIDLATVGAPAFENFVERVEASGVTLKPAMSKDGQRLNGMSWAVDGVTLKGSAMGSRYGWGQLSKHLDFDLERDRALLLALRDGTPRPKKFESVPTATAAEHGWDNTEWHHELHQTSLEIEAEGKRQGQGNGGAARPRVPSAQRLGERLANRPGSTVAQAVKAVAKTQGQRVSFQDAKTEADFVALQALATRAAENAAEHEANMKRIAAQTAALHDELLRRMTEPTPPTPPTPRRPRP